MCRLVSVGTAEMPYRVSQEELRIEAQEILSYPDRANERIFSVFDNALIENRNLVNPPEWYKVERGFVERSECFVRSGLKISRSAVDKCTEYYGGSYSDFDHIIFVTSTGISAPTIDALLINELNLDPHLTRTPVWGLGCAGGAAGISRAMDYCRAYPHRSVLLLALEICSLAFHPEDTSNSSVVASAIFSDGAAAALIAGKKHKLHGLDGLNLADSLSTTYHDTLDVMGWEVVEDGLKPIFSKDIPLIVRNRLKSNIEELLAANRLGLEDLNHYLAHPGGAKVLMEYESALGLEYGSLIHSRSVLRKHGNMSSPTVLYVIGEFLSKRNYKTGDKGIISALGPGFSSELVLFDAA